MEKPQEDRRIQRTKKLFETTLLEMLKTKSINQITVKDLAGAIDMNRGTFYNHYTDIYDLLETVEDNLIDNLRKITNQINSSGIKKIEEKHKLTQITKALEYIKSNEQIFKILLSEKGNILFLEKIKKVFREKFLCDMIIMSSEHSSQYYESIILFFISGAIGLIQEWLETERKITPVELAIIIENIIVKGISSLDIKIR